MLVRLAAILDRVLAPFLAVLLAAVVLAVTWQVVSRYLLGDPSGWTQELARFLLVWIGLFGGALAYQRRLHLGLDLLSEKRKSAMTGTVNLCVLLFAVAVLVVGGGALVALTLELEQYSPALGLPMAVVYLGLPASGLLLAVSALAALRHPARNDRRSDA
jgi:TRAP-type C4-dicarboxylate transport system permease small subunit